MSEPQGKMDFDSDFGADQNKSLRRPWVAFFHFFFRISALIVYLFGSLTNNSFMGIFVTVVLLLSLDFWTVKNVSGRIMVTKNTEMMSILLKIAFAGRFKMVELHKRRRCFRMAFWVQRWHIYSGLTCLKFRRKSRRTTLLGRPLCRSSHVGYIFPHSIIWL